LAGWYFRYQSIHIQITYTYLSFTRQHFHIQSFISPLQGNRYYVMEYLCYKWPQICSTCRKHFPVLSSFMTYHWVCN
jgi:hypothetical protein